MAKKRLSRTEYLNYMSTDTNSILGKLDSQSSYKLHTSSPSNALDIKPIDVSSGRSSLSRPSFNAARSTGFSNSVQLGPKVLDKYGSYVEPVSDSHELALQNELAPPVSSESIEGGTNRPDLRDESIQEARSRDQKLAIESSFTTFPDDFLIINDIFLYKVPTAGISITSRSDVFVGETLRTKAPVISTQGRQDFVLNLSLVFNPGEQQTRDLRRLVSEISRHPLVFIFNNKVRKSIGVSEFATTMFILEAGTLRSSSESVGTIILDLQLHYFNHRPFSNNFFFNAKMPGISYSSDDQDDDVANEPLKLDDLTGYEASDYVLERRTEELRQEIRDNVRQIKDTSSRNVPVNFPSESDSWMYYADHLTNLTPIISETPSDYIGLSVRIFEAKNPPDDAKQGLGTIKGSLVGKISRPPVKSIYDATKPLPESKTVQEKNVEDTHNKPVQAAALEGTPIKFHSYDSGRDDSIILTASPGVPHRDASRRLSQLCNVGKDLGAAEIQNELVLHLQKVANRFPGRTIQVYSASRFPKNPKKFYAKPVEKRSKHATGHAMDLRVQNVSNKELFKFIRTIPNSGCGYYPNSKFCHLDYRPRKTFWVDLSGPGQESIDLKGQAKIDYVREHVYGSDTIEAQADKVNKSDKRKSTEQQKDAAAPKSDQFAKQEEELYKQQTKVDDSIGHEVNDPVTRSLQARADWIKLLYDQGGWIYYDDDTNRTRNLFYRESSVEITSSLESRRDPNILKDIVCSAISVQFGHRIAPMRLLSQSAYTYQFLGAGNKAGQMVFTFAGKNGRDSADRLKRLLIAARDNARNYGSFIKEAGSVQINTLNYNTGEQNNILSLLSIDSIVVTNIKESSLSESVDKHQIIVEFIVQDFQEESFEKLFVDSLDNRKRIAKQLFSYLTRNKYGVVPKPSISRYQPFNNNGDPSYRPYVLNKEVPSWVSTLISRAATICRETDSDLPPTSWRLGPNTSKTWKDIYAEWGADKIMKGYVKNIYPYERNRTVVNGIEQLGIEDQRKNREEMEAGSFQHNGGSTTNKTHSDAYRRWLGEVSEIIKEVKRHISDEKTFEKYFGSIGNDMLAAVSQDMGQCYDDLLLPDIPHTTIPLPPEFYVYDDSDESPVISSLTDPTNMEKFLKQHVLNEVQSISLYMRERLLGGSYLAKNLPRILENRRYYDEQMSGEYNFFDNFWKIYQEGATAWEPITYKEDPSIDQNPDVVNWKKTTFAGLGASNEQEARYEYASKLVSLSNYIKKGRHWQTSYTEQEDRNLVLNMYGNDFDKTCFGPNPEFNRADAASAGIALPERTLTQTQLIEQDAYSKVARENKKALPLGSDKTVLPNGDIVYGATQAEKTLEEYSGTVEYIETLKPVTDFLKSAVSTALGVVTGTLKVEPAVKEAKSAFNIASAGQNVSKIIKQLDHYTKDKVNNSNQNDKLASMIAGMTIGSKADDLSIRRVYPTFKIYFIEEDSEETEMMDGKVVRAFDDFYSYSAVQEIKITRSRRIAADLAVVRMTNIGGILLSRRFGEKDPRQNQRGERQGIFADTEKEHPFEKMILQDGVKVQIRLGYAANPDNLDSVFLGQIVEISPAENGKILEIMCQGYGAELEAIELGELEDGPTYTSTQEALSSAILQDSISTFGRQSKFNRFNPAEIRHAWTGGHADGLLGRVNPANLIRDWADQNMDQHFQKYTFLNYPQDDNIFAPPPSSYASTWMTFWNNACIFRPLRQTPWQIFKEHELRHPGYISMAVPYGHAPRMTMFFGSKMQHYWSRPPSALELHASTNAYNTMVRMRGKVASGDIGSFVSLVRGMQKEMNEKPRLMAAMLKDIVLAGSPTKTAQALAKESGRYRPFRNYHYFDSYHHILKNEIRTSVDGTFNEVEILFFEDEDKIQEGNTEELINNIRSLGTSQEGVFAVKLDENIPESSLRSYREEFPSCITVDMARRYAQGILARHLRDAYKGELIVIGKETLKPYDICYINDASVNMTGPIEVEQVTHIFNRDYGFISIITPDLCVDINDMFSATVFDVAASAYNSVWNWAENIYDFNPTLAIGKGINNLAIAAGVKVSMWTQDGDPVVPTPLTLGGKPFMSVSMGPNQSSLFLNLHGKWVQYWDDLGDAWHKFDIAEELFDARVGFKSKIYSMLGTGTGAND